MYETHNGYLFVSETPLGHAIIAALSDDLRRPPWRGSPHPMAGHCYVASEAFWHLMGGPSSGFTPQVIRHEGATHWFLKDTRGGIVDLTASQFETPVPYDQARGCGFLTRQASQRARTLILRVMEED